MPCQFPEIDAEICAFLYVGRAARSSRCDVMTTAEELTAIADDISHLDAAIACRLRAIAARVRSHEARLDEFAEEGRLSARIAEGVAVEHLAMYRRRR